MCLLLFKGFSVVLVFDIMRSSIVKSHSLLNDGTAPERHNAQLKIRCALCTCKSKSKRVTVKIVPTDSSRVFISSYWYW